MTAIKEKPILFSAPMVQAILDGRKTMTRRVIKIQPKDNRYELSRLMDSTGSDDKKNIDKYCWLYADGLQIIDRDDRYFSLPFKPGLRLWVKETWAAFDSQAIKDRDRSKVFYRADDQTNYSSDGKWKPSIFMPRWASRILLEVTEVRIERLQDISEKDAWAEGCEGYDDDVTGGKSGYREFAELWDSINAKRDPKHIRRRRVKGKPIDEWEEKHPPQPSAYSWDANPFVWVISFRRFDHEPPQP